MAGTWIWTPAVAREAAKAWTPAGALGRLKPGLQRLRVRRLKPGLQRRVSYEKRLELPGGNSSLFKTLQSWRVKPRQRHCAAG